MEGTHQHRVAFVEDYLGGGIGKVIVNLGNNLLKYGIAVDVLVDDLVRSELYLHQLHPDIRVVKLHTLHRQWGMPGMIRYLRKTNVAAMLTSSERLTTIVVLARKFSGNLTKVFGCVHNFNVHWLEANPPRHYRREYRRIARNYPLCEKVVCVSEGLRRKFVEKSGLPEDLVCTIYNPIVTTDMALLACEPVEHPWFADHRVPIILGVGRLAEQKDFATLLKAFAIVREKIDCRLVILGEGKLRSELEQLAAALPIAPYLDLHGQVPNTYNFMRHADVFASSSIHEALSCVLIEALALGAPIVSTDCPYGPDEILEHGRYGQLTPVGDAPAFAAALEIALTSPRPTGIAQTIIDRFDIDHITQEYLQLFGMVSYDEARQGSRVNPGV